MHTEASVTCIRTALGLALAISSFEYFLLLRRRQFISFSSFLIEGDWFKIFGLDKLCVARNDLVQSIFVVRGLCGLAIAVPYYHTILIVPIVLSIILTLLGCKICPLGLEGSDQMSLILLIAVAPTLVSRSLSDVANFFIAAQLLLAYFTAGAVKLVSPVWRTHEALVGVMGTSIYGHRRLRAILDGRYKIAKLVSWGVVALELLFPFSIFFHDYFFYCFIAAGFLFHMSNALFMGLNVFFITFVGAYPAILWLHHNVTHF